MGDFIDRALEKRIERERDEARAELARVREELERAKGKLAELEPLLVVDIREERAAREKAEAERDKLQEALDDLDAYYRAQYAAAGQHDRQRAERAESRLQTFADSVERDRHEPDKLLCHVQSMRSAALRTGEKQP